MEAVIRLAKRLVLVSLLIAVIGCASGRQQLGQEFNSLVGVAEKAYFAARYGPPDKQAIIDEHTEMWEYRLGEQKYTSPTGYRFSTFDRLRVVFRNGRLKSWTLKGEVE